MGKVIKNLWGMTKFFCGHGHEIPVEMTYKVGPASMFYSCPRYYVDNVNRPGERACSNRLSFEDAEAIVMKLSDAIVEHEEAGQNVNLENYEFDYRQTHVKVIRYTQTEVWLEILNRKALR